MEKIISGAIGLVIGVALVFIFAPSPQMGGLIHNAQESFDAGIAVNGTEIINSSGNVASQNGISVTCLAASSTTYVAGIATSCD